MPIKARQETLAQFTVLDKAALKAIYWHRCLDERLLNDFFYHDEDLTLERIRWMVAEELLSIEEFGEDEHCVFSLTNRGLQSVRALYDTPFYIIDPRTHHKVYDVTASTVKVAKSLLDHQLHLNELALDIEHRCELPETYYKDCKFAVNFTYAQPDGVFELPLFDLFLEMDMAHERTSDLLRKWEHYRTYFSSRDYYLHRNKKIIVLFATENIKRGLAYRRSKVLATLSRSIFDLFGDMFDCYIGPSDEMAKVAQILINGKDSESFLNAGRLLQTQFGFQFRKPQFMMELCRESYLYMCQPDEAHHAIIRDGRHQEFFFENYELRSVAVLHRIASYASILSLIFPTTGRPIPLLVLAPSEKEMYQDLKSIDGLGIPNVFFITESRLRHYTLHNAIFWFDQAGNRYHFSDYSLTERIHEKKGEG